MIKFEFEESDLKFDHAMKQDVLDISYFEQEEEIDPILLRSNIAFAEAVFGNRSVKKNKALISDHASELMSVFQSIGVESDLFYSEKSVSAPFCRQHRYIMELGDLTYNGAEVTSVNFPSVGFEIVTRKYMRNFGIYTPQFGVISSNRISHVIYGFCEYPLGDEVIVFTITAAGRSYRYWWGPDGIVFLGEGSPITAYYILPPDNDLIQVGGLIVDGIRCKRNQWFHMCKLDETKDYIVNIDGVNYLLMGIRKLVVNVEENLARVGNNFRSLDLFDGTYFYDLDSKVAIISTTRSPESFGTYEHIMKNGMVVREFLLFTKMLNITVKASVVLHNVEIIPNGSSTVDFDKEGSVVLFDRASAKLGTSRNYNVFQRINRLRHLILDDTVSMNVSFVGNNRVSYNRKKYYVRIPFNHLYAAYIGKKKSCLFELGDVCQTYDTQVGTLFSLRFCEPLEQAQLLNRSLHKISNDLRDIKAAGRAVQGEKNYVTHVAIDSLVDIISAYLKVPPDCNKLISSDLQRNDFVVYKEFGDDKH